MTSVSMALVSAAIPFDDMFDPTKVTAAVPVLIDVSPSAMPQIRPPASAFRLSLGGVPLIKVRDLPRYMGAGTLRHDLTVGIHDAAE
jgi:hypothetical protein